MRPVPFLDRIVGLLRELAGTIPPSTRGWARRPGAEARALGRAAALRAAAVSGSLALPPGPIGLLTLLPDLLLLWRIQGQMVSDIAAVYGKSALLTREGMIYCLFKHSAAQAVRRLAIGGGERLLVRRASGGLFESALRQVGIQVSEQLASKSLSHWLPLVGAVGVGAYAYLDTARIARTAIDAFGSELVVEAG